MDAWIIIIAIGVVFWWINNNKSKSVVKIKVTETSEYKTPTGTVRVEKTHENIDSDFSIKNGQSHTKEPIKNYTPLQQPLIINQENNNAYHDKLKQEYSELKNRVEKIIPVNPLIIENKKECPNCQRLLETSLFRKSGKNEDGLTKWCSDCLGKSSNSSIPTHLKLCPKCKHRRLKSSFAKNSKTSDGLAKWCKYCMSGVKR